MDDAKKYSYAVKTVHHNKELEQIQRFLPSVTTQLEEGKDGGKGERGGGKWMKSHG